MVYSILQIAFAAIGLLSIVAALLLRPKRGVFVLAFLAAFAGWASAFYQVFWTTATFALLLPWILFCALPILDTRWRVKAGFTVALALGAALALYPTYRDEIQGKEPFDVASAKAGKSGFRKFLLANMPFRLVRGLDLKGGLRLVYNVDVEEAIRDKRDRLYDDLRAALTTLFGFHAGDTPPTVEEMQKLADKARLAKAPERADTIIVTLSDPADAEKVTEEFLQPFRGEVQLQKSPDRKTLTFRIRGEVESQIRSNAVAQAKETVLKRIDALGLKEASVTTRDEDIIVEVPGDDTAAFEEIKEIISQTARLEFKMLDDDVDFFGPIAREAKAEDLPKGLRFEPENAPVGPGKSKPVYVAKLIRGEGEEMRDALRRFQDWVATLDVPDDHEIGFGKIYDEDETGKVEEIGWRSYYLFSRAEVTGDMVSDAQAVPDQSQSGLGGWYVQMRMTSVGADRFENITEKNIKRRFAIILDEKVESAPVIQSKIGGGVAQITMGSATADQQLRDARKLELVLRSGALPAPISLQNEQLIGPSLGQDAIKSGLNAAGIGAALVLAFMLIYYSRAGIIADLAVVFNLFLQLAVLAMFGASLTLPGIAGLALTIGISVDANVLINERIREELRQGKSPRAAVDIGYDKAFSAILDGHVTTLISGLILAQYGSGPIKGFAVTLIVGIAVSLFTGVVCTRLLFDIAVRGRRVKKLHLGQSEA